MKSIVPDENLLSAKKGFGRVPEKRIVVDVFFPIPPLNTPKVIVFETGFLRVTDCIHEVVW
jgi:hypothetical protein